jgi:hypothetical protein
LKGLALLRLDHLASYGKAKYHMPIAPLSDTGGMGFIMLGAFYKCGPTQLNTHFEGVSDHRDKHDLLFSGLA